jgi:hypothetical protein
LKQYTGILLRGLFVLCTQLLTALLALYAQLASVLVAVAQVDQQAALIVLLIGCVLVSLRGELLVALNSRSQ